MLRAFGTGRLVGEHYGDGPVRVLWLHGWARTHADFTAAARQLANSGISSVALDLPGFGASTVPDVPGGAREYGAQVAAVLAEISPEPLVVVGHSLGGRVAAVLAAGNPASVSALVLTGAPLVRVSASSRSPRAYRVIRWLHARGLVSSQSMEAARQRHGSLDYRNSTGVMRQVLVMMVNEDYTDELSRWRGPTSLVWGEFDHDVPVAVAAAIRERLGGPVNLSVLPGVGHLVPTEAPELLVDNVRRHLS